MHFCHIAARVARAVRDDSGCQGLNLMQSNEKAAQQDVFHLYLHIVPRFEGDRIPLSWDNIPAPAGELERLASAIRSHLQEEN